LIEGLGEILSVGPEGGGRVVRVSHPFGAPGVALGDSVAVNGICLTATSFPDARSFVAVAGRETVERTTLGTWRPGRRVHLERALRLDSRLGGHIVQGHVDATGVLVEASPREESRVLWFDLPPDLVRYVAPKGSIAFDGVSLTVNAVDATRVRVNLIPHSWANTVFSSLRGGDRVNVEVDVLARYVERLLTPPASPEPGDTLLARLQENGFLG